MMQNLFLQVLNLFFSKCIILFKCSGGSVYLLAAFERDMLSGMTAIQLTLDGVMQELASLRKEVQISQRGDNNKGLPDDIIFPLASVEQLEELEVKLLDKNIIKRVVSIYIIMFLFLLFTFIYKINNALMSAWTEPAL